MASISHPMTSSSRLQQPWAGSSCWLNCFGEQDRRAMIDSDLAAGKSVSAVLVSVIAVGLLLMIVTVSLVI